MRGELPDIGLLYRRYIAILKDNNRPCSVFEQKYIGSALWGRGERGLKLSSPNVGEKLHTESLNPGEK